MMVRTTVTLDEDCVARIRDHMQRTGRSFKQAVNEAIRVGLSADSRETNQRSPFRVQAVSMGLRNGLSYDNIGDLLEQVEGPTHL